MAWPLSASFRSNVQMDQVVWLSRPEDGSSKTRISVSETWRSVSARVLKLTQKDQELWQCHQFHPDGKAFPLFDIEALEKQIIRKNNRKGKHLHDIPSPGTPTMASAYESMSSIFRTVST